MNNVEFLTSPDASDITVKIIDEMNRQDAKFGPQRKLSIYKWLAILVEEVGEINEAALEIDFNHNNSSFAKAESEKRAMNETSEEMWTRNIQTELIQVMAVCFQMLLAIKKEGVIL